MDSSEGTDHRPGDPMTTTATTTHADHLAAELRDRRCCDALDPCRSCKVGRMTVQVERALVRVPAQRKGD